MVYTGEDYDDIREGDPHFKTMESDFAAIVGEREAMKLDTKIRTFHTGATRDTDEGKLDWEGFISPLAMRYFAKYMHEHRHQADGTLRDADNWQKGMPRRQYMKSLIRHIWDLWTWWRQTGGGFSEASANARFIELLCAMLFNIQGLLHEIAMGRDVGE